MKYKGLEVKKLPKFIKVRGWFTFGGTIYLHPLIYSYWISSDSWAVGEAIQTLEHEYTHIQQYKKLGMFRFFRGCLPWYLTSKIELEAIKAGNIQKSSYLRGEVDKYGRQK